MGRPSARPPQELGLDAPLDVADDPFFGRAGRMLAASQREQQLKFELLVSDRRREPTAIASFNYHQDHFAGDLRDRAGRRREAHTACLGFGLDRIMLALLRRHGLDPRLARRSVASSGV